VQITRVFPSSINTLPSAVEIKSGVIFYGPQLIGASSVASHFAALADGKRTRNATLCPLDYFLGGALAPATGANRRVCIHRKTFPSNPGGPPKFFRFLAMNQNLQTPHTRHIRF